MSIVVESSNYTTQNRSHRARRTHVFSSIPGHRRCWDSCRKPHRRSWPSGLKTRCSGTAAQRTKMKHVVTNAAVCCKHLEYVCGLITKSFTASGQTKAVHNPAHCAGFADAFGGACHHDFVTRNFPVCKLEGSVSRQSNQIWLASSCILGQDSVEVRCRKCDEAEMEIQGRYR